MSRFRWSLCAWLAVTACAHHGQAAPTAATPSPQVTPDSAAPSASSSNAAVTLRVTNSNWSDVRIYLARGAMWVRLGIVTTNNTIEFTVPAEFVRASGTVTVVADPVGARKSWSTQLPAITPGDEFELVIENFLQYSHLVLR